MRITSSRQSPGKICSGRRGDLSCGRLARDSEGADAFTPAAETAALQETAKCSLLLPDEQVAAAGRPGQRYIHPAIRKLIAWWN